MFQQTAVAPASQVPASTSDSATPLVIGASFGGGYFAGTIKVDGAQYGLVMAGTAGELSGRWNASTEHVTGAHSFVDGVKNTAAMALAGSKLAQRVMDLSLNGCEDWYIPSRDELELAYRHFKPSTTDNWGGNGHNENSVPPGDAYTDTVPAQTRIAALIEDEADAMIPAWYWSSTQYAADPSDAWFQHFGKGSQRISHKSYAGRARAFRRFKI